MNSKLLFGLVVSIALPSPGARAQETTTYTYDQGGRLLTGAIQGGTNSGVLAKNGYDAAGNRTVSDVAIPGGPTCSVMFNDPQVTDESSLYIYFHFQGTCPSPIRLTFSTQNGSALENVHYYGKSGDVIVNASPAGLVEIVPIKFSLPAGSEATFYVNFTAVSANVTLPVARSTVTLISSL